MQGGFLKNSADLDTQNSGYATLLQSTVNLQQCSVLYSQDPLIFWFSKVQICYCLLGVLHSKQTDRVCPVPCQCCGYRFDNKFWKKVQYFAVGHKKFQVKSETGSGRIHNQMAPWTGYVSQNYRSSDRDPKEIFADTWYVINLSTTLAESI